MEAERPRSWLVNKGPSKTERTQLRILEAAVEVLSKYGLEDANFEKVAVKAKVSRPLVVHYFSTKEQMIERVLFYISNKAGLFIENYYSQNCDANSTGAELLQSYVIANFRWLEKFPGHFRTWILVIHLCTFNRKWAQFNSEIKGKAIERLEGFIKKGVAEGSIKSKKTLEDARLFHSIVYSCALMPFTEDRVSHNSVDAARSLAMAAVRRLFPPLHT